MKELLFTLVVSGVAVSGGGPFAQGPAATSPNQGNGAAAKSTLPAFPRLRLRGTIEHYDASTRVLSLSTTSGTLRLLLASTARIGRGAQVFDASELGKLSGYLAAVRYLETDGSRTVESVNVFGRDERIAR